MDAKAPNRLAVFDCDGTLVDSQHNIVAAMSHALSVHGIPEPGPDAVRRVVGLHLAEAVSNLVPVETSSEIRESIAGAYVEAFRVLREQPDHREPLFPGVNDMLATLADNDTVLAVATGKSRRGLVRTLERHDLENRFFTLKTADDGPGKPDPAILLDAMAEAGAAPETTVMIGDTVFDIAMARSAKAHAVGVVWGYHDPAELEAAGAHAILGHFDQLPTVLDKLWSAG